MTAGTRQGIVPGKDGVVKDLSTQSNPLLGKGIVIRNGYGGKAWYLDHHRGTTHSVIENLVIRAGDQTVTKNTKQNPRD